MKNAIDIKGVSKTDEKTTLDSYGDKYDIPFDRVFAQQRKGKYQN